MSFLRKVGQIGGNVLRGIGRIGGQVISRVGLVKSIYDGANDATGGMIGKTLEGLPLVGGALKFAGQIAGNQKALDKIGGVFGKIEQTGAMLNSLSGGGG